MEHSAGYAITMVLCLGLAAQWFAWRFRLPAIVLLSVAGLLAGPVFGVLYPSADFGDFLRPVISLCVAIILFEGGLTLQFHELREAASGVRRLVYLGVPLAWICGTLAGHFVGDLSWPVALVFGAIVVVTGPTVILPMLRHAMLIRRTASYLKWEGIINDPIGALLAVLVFQYFVFSGEEFALSETFASLGRAVMTAMLLGAIPGWLAGKAFSRGYVPEYLKGPMTVALVLAMYTVSNQAQHEAGLLAVTVMGIVMGNMGLPSIQEMRRFKEYITIILVSSVFVLLTADLRPEVLMQFNWHHAALVAAMVFVARPVCVWLATFRSDMTWRDKLLVGWIAPRGIVAAAVTGVFAPRMVEAGYADAYLLVPIMFALIFTTVLLHSTTLGPIARRLGLAAKKKNRVLIVGASPWTTELARQLRSLDVGVLLTDTSWHRLREARLDGIPVYYGEILSDSAEESVELNDVGTLLAATSNDAYNALVCNRFGTELGRAQVFQLPMYDADDDDPRGLARANRGQIAFNEKAVYEDLWSHLAEGWKFHKTRITESYGLEQHMDEWADDAIQIAIVGEEGGVSLNTPQSQANAKAGDTIISFGRERTESLQQTLTRDPATDTTP